MQTLPYPPFYGGSTPNYAADISRASRNTQGQKSPLLDLPRAPYGDHVTALSGVGAADPAVLFYVVASWVGATLGGGLVGYIASGKRDGAMLGGAFTAGLAGVSDAFLLNSQGRRGTAAAAGIVGLSALSWSLYRFNKRR